MTISFISYERRGRCLLQGSPERPGMVTLLAPWISVMTPWERTLVAAKARTMTELEYCIVMIVGYQEEGCFS